MSDFQQKITRDVKGHKKVHAEESRKTSEPDSDVTEMLEFLQGIKKKIEQKI